MLCQTALGSIVKNFKMAYGYRWRGNSFMLYVGRNSRILWTWHNHLTFRWVLYIGNPIKAYELTINNAVMDSVNIVWEKKVQPIRPEVNRKCTASLLQLQSYTSGWRFYWTLLYGPGKRLLQETRRRKVIFVYWVYIYLIGHYIPSDDLVTPPILWTYNLISTLNDRLENSCQFY